MFAENVYIVTDDATGKVAIIDPGVADDTVFEKLVGDGELVYIILTHGHGDHITGVPAIKAAYPEAKIVADFDEHDMISDSYLNGSARMFGTDVEFDADIYVTDGEKLQLGETELTFIHTPGHTKGGMCVYTGKYLFSGDTLFKRSVGRTDLPGGDWDKLRESIKEKLYALPDDTDVYPGHGYMTTIGSEKRGNPFV